MANQPITRRMLLAEGASALAGSALLPAAASPLRLSAALRPARARAATASQREALRVLGRTTLRMPGSRPNMALSAGTDTLPGVEHIVILMLENHSFDNFLGTLGRGDGFTLGADGLPTATNPLSDGRLQRAFRMPTTCQLPGKPSQEWQASHMAFDNGRMDGFCTAIVNPTQTGVVGPVAMGYWTGEDLPFTHDLARAFPLADRWFSSCLGQTDPQRRFLIAATASGMTDDIGGNPVGDAGLLLPANGTIFDSLTEAGISWTDYATNNTTGATANLYPEQDGALVLINYKPQSEFFTDAAAGKLPSVSLIEPDFGTQSQENPQNIVVGEAFMESVVRALASGPGWLKTLLVICYDEHGGYYDHVPPPVALAPDAIPPQVLPGESTYDGFARYGFRVPGLVVSSFAKRDFVSHTVYDHTSILALIERKWNLAALSLRDANANDLLDMLDLDALAKRTPTFAELPKLRHAGDTPAALACSRTGPGMIPPKGSVLPAAPSTAPARARIEVRYYGRRRRRRGIVVELSVTSGVVQDVVVELRRGHTVIAAARAQRVTTARKVVILRRKPGPYPPAGRYTLIVTAGSQPLIRRAVEVG